MDAELREKTALAIFGGKTLPTNWETDSRIPRVMELIQQEIAKARIDEIQRYDHMTYRSRDEFEAYIQQRQAGLSQTLKERKED